MDIQQLKQRMPYQWKIQTFSKSSPKASCVAYIDARDVMKVLDEVAGAENWQDKYEGVNGKMFCSLGIKVGDQWVWKTDAGAESDIEKEKGEASDAFKRAAVKWGIGRFLYDEPIKWVNTNEKKEGTNRPHPVDAQGKQIWDMTDYINNIMPKEKGVAPKAQLTQQATPKPTHGERQYTCPACHNVATIMEGISKDKTMPDGTFKKGGKPYKGLRCSENKAHMYWDSSEEYKHIVEGEHADGLPTVKHDQWQATQNLAEASHAEPEDDGLDQMTNIPF
jgi:hypothetical protein